MRRALVLLALSATACVATPPILIGDAAPPVTAPPAQIAVRVLDYRGDPLPGAEITANHAEGSEDVVTDDNGLAFVTWDPRGLTLDATATAHEQGAMVVDALPEAEQIEVRLTAKVLTGTVFGLGGRPLVGATVRMGSEEILTGTDGAFQFVAVEEGTPISVERSAYVGLDERWEGGHVDLELAPLVVRGIRAGGVDARTPEKWAEILAIAESTEVNTVVVDIKGESGQIFYATEVPFALEVGAVYSTYDVGQVVEDVRSRGLYLVGRIVSFQDPIAARSAPDIAVFDTVTGQPYTKNGQYFLDPTDPGARSYALDLAVEACNLGFQEIQFDYVRYPDGFPDHARFDGGASDAVRPETIRTFLSEAQTRLNPLGCAVSADIFGFITRTTGDGGIGQQLEMLAGVTDALSPMIYPSHYSTGWYGFEVPNDHPGPVVANAIDDGLERIEGEVILRPWIQDFYYTDEQVREQIDVAGERNVGWMLWNAVANYSVGALDPVGLTQVATEDAVGG